MLISCRHCHHSTAEEAKVCPHCGGEPYLRLHLFKDVAYCFFAALVFLTVFPQWVNSVLIPLCIIYPFIKAYMSHRDLEKRRKAEMIMDDEIVTNV